jgi:hypothetical protein
MEAKIGAACLLGFMTLIETPSRIEPSLLD